MKTLVKILFILSLTAFWGCAVKPQLNVNASDAFWQNKEQKIGVYVSSIPEVKGHIAGANCLLCLAAASAANAKLHNHIKTQSTDDIKNIKSEIIAKLQERGLQTVSIDEPINFKKLPKNKSKGPNASKKGFIGLGKKLGVDQILVLDIAAIGTLRNFANYIPVGQPSAIFNATMYIVNTKTNVYEHYESIRISQFSETDWKEPPNFPGLTNAYYTAIENARNTILDLETFTISAAK